MVLDFLDGGASSLHGRYTYMKDFLKGLFSAFMGHTLSVLVPQGSPQS